jgi:hypothetical protein
MSRLEDLFMGAADDAKNALRFYEEHYVCVGQWVLDPAVKVVLRSSHPGVCRFCGLTVPNVTFKTEAHAIPECLGNKSLTTDYECDDCNQFFGLGIENDFGNWSKAQRALSGIRGKKKIPALKGGTSRPWRFEHDSSEIRVTQDERDAIALVDEVSREITLTVPQDPYTPIAVLKAFSKMALSLLPEEELPNFPQAMAWIRNTDHRGGLVKTSCFPVLHTFVPGTDPFPNVAAIVLRRRTDDLLVPYLTFVLSYGNEVFQTILPSPERDASIHGKKLKFPHFPTAYELDPDLRPVAPIRRDRIDLTGRTVVKGESLQTVLSFDVGGSEEPAGRIERPR